MLWNRPAKLSGWVSATVQEENLEIAASVHQTESVAGQPNLL